MRYFVLLDFQHMVLAFFIGLITVILVNVAWWRYPLPDPEQPQEQVQTGDGTPVRPVPPILIFVIVGVLLAAIGYVIVVGIMGNAIS